MPDSVAESLRRIETNQQSHSLLTTEKLENISTALAVIITKQESCKEVQEDHETRIRKNESVTLKVTSFFSIMSLFFGATVAWAVEKLLSIGN
jgi:hypothetical protein